MEKEEPVTASDRSLVVVEREPVNLSWSHQRTEVGVDRDYEEGNRRST